VLKNSFAGKPQKIRLIWKMENQALVGLAGKFQAMCSRKGRPSIAPEKLRRALLLQVLYTISSARMLMEQPDWNLLFCRFVGLFMDYKSGVPRPEYCWTSLSPETAPSLRPGPP
jgi:hypothetical protein